MNTIKLRHIYGIQDISRNSEKEEYLKSTVAKNHTKVSIKDNGSTLFYDVRKMVE